MKYLSKTVSIFTLCSITLFSCSQEKMEAVAEERPVEAYAGIQKTGNYAVSLGLTSAPGTSTWTYAIKKKIRQKISGILYSTWAAAVRVAPPSAILLRQR